MRIFQFELKKLAGNRFLWCFCILLFLLNLWTLRERARTSYPSAESIKAAYQDFAAVPKRDQETWLDEKKGKLGMEPGYTGNMFSEQELLKRMEKELKQIQGYEDYLDEIEIKAEEMTAIIFSNDQSFAYRNAQRTPQVFEKLRGLKLKADVSDGIELATRAGFTDFCLFFAVIAVSYFLSFRERRNKLDLLLKSTGRGRQGLIKAKIWTAAVVSALLVLLFYGTNYLVGFVKYGFGDLLRPVQSVLSLYESPFKLTAGGYLCLYLALKFMVCFVILLLSMFLAQTVKSSAGMAAYVCGIGAVQYAMTVFLPEHSYLDVFRYVNLAEYIKVYPLLEKYHNLNFFDYPIHSVSVFGGFLLLALFFLSAGNIRKFCRTSRERTKREKGSLAGKLQMRKPRITSLFFCELRKLCVTHKAAWLVFLLLSGAVLLSTGRIKEFDSAENVYRTYMLDIEGHLTTEKMQYFEEKKAEFEEIFRMTPESSGLTKEQIQIRKSGAMYTYPGFMRAYQQAQYVKEWNQKHPDRGLPLLYETGYQVLFGELSPAYTGSTILLGILAAVYAASVTLGGEYDLHVMKLLRSTKRGRISLLLNKVLTVSLFGVLMAVLVQIPAWMEINRQYPMNIWNVRIQSISTMNQITGDWSIAEYMILVRAGQFLGILIVILAVMALSTWVKDTVMTMVIAAVLFLFPLVLEWYGFSRIHFFSLNGILETQKLLQSSYAVLFCYVAVFILALPVLCIRRFYRICKDDRQERIWKYGLKT